MRIKFIDLAAQNQEITERIEHELGEIHSRTAYVGGEQVAEFEKEFARFLGAERVVGLANGTDALRLALLAIGVGAGDEAAGPAGCNELNLRHRRKRARPRW